MNKIKKAVAVLLAFSLIFGSVSLMSTAVMNDGLERTYISLSKFYRYDGTDWVPTTKVAPGDSVKVRVWLESDFYAGPSQYMYLYTQGFMTFNPSTYHYSPQNKPCLPANPNPYSFQRAFYPTEDDNMILHAVDETSLGTTSFSDMCENLPDEFNSEFFSHWDAVTGMIASTGYSRKLPGYNPTPDGLCSAEENWIFEFDFDVSTAADAPTDGVFKLDLNTICDFPAGRDWNAYYFTRCANGNKLSSQGEACYMWEDVSPDVYTTDAYLSTQNTITFHAAGGEINGEAEFQSEGTVGTAFNANNAPTVTPPATMVFNGWVDGDNNPVDLNTLEYDYSDNGIDVYASYVAGSGIGYATEYYEMALDGTYPATATRTETATGGTGNPVAAATTDYTGFSFDAANANNVITDTIAADGSTVLKVYMARNQHTVTFTDAKNPPASVTSHYYGASYTAPTPAAVQGYSFLGWADADIPAPTAADAVTFPQTLGDAPAAYQAIWEADDLTVTYSYAEQTLVGTPPVLPANITDAHVGDVFSIPAAAALAGYTFEWAITGAASVDTVNNTFTMGTEPVSVVGTFTPIDYTVTYVYEGAVPGNAPAAPASVTANVGDTIALPAVSDIEGYTLGDWYSDDVTLAQGATSFTMPAGSVELAAQWDVKTFTVNYYIDDQHLNLYESYTVAYDEEIPVPTDPTLAGQEFSGWDPEGGLMEDISPETVLDITATWTPVEYIFTFIGADGAELGTSDVMYWDDELTEDDLPDPSEEGWIFDGNWYFNYDEGTGYSDAITFPLTIDESVDVAQDIYAGMTLGTYTATFVATGENNEYPGAKFSDNNATKSIDVEFYDDIVFTDEPTLEGYTFLMWSEEPGIMDTEGKTFYAFFEAIDYDVSYSVTNAPAGAPAAPATATANVGDTVTVADPLSFTGYVFDGWYYNGNKVTSVTMPADDITLTGSWSAATDTAYTVTTYTMGTDGNYTSTSETLYGTTGATAYATPASVAAGFELNAADSTLTGTIAADGSLVLEVYIDRNTYTFTTDVDGVKVDTDYLYGAIVAEPETPTKTGHTFSEWLPAVPGTMPADNVTVVAQWDVNSYDVKFFDGVDTDAIYETSVNYNGDIAAYTEPEREGYTFAGWMSDYDSTVYQTADFPLTMPASAVNLTAQWTANTYHVTFRSLATIVDEFDVEYNGEIEPPIANPTREGHTFLGWALLGTTDIVTFPQTMGTAAVTYMAQWQANTYNVKYYIDNELVSTVPYLFNAPITALEAETREGYTFSGWTEIPATMPASDVRVDGSYTANSYTITYQYVGAPQDAPAVPAVQTAQYNTTAVLNDAAEFAGYTFDGWYYNGNKVTSITMPAEDITVTGSWIAGGQTYYVEVYYQDTTGAYLVTPDSVLDFAAATNTSVSYTMPSVEGFTADTANSTLSGTVPGTGSLTLVAKYSRNQYDFTTDVDGVTETTPYYFGAAVATPTAPTKTGHTFSEWLPAVPGTMPADDVTVVAQWDVNSYDVNYYVDSEPYDTESYEYGAQVTAIAEPSREGHTFSGWSEIPSTMPAENVTVEGTFTVNSYDVTFEVDGAVVLGPTSTPYGSVIATPTTPAKAGYEFIGWYTATTGGSPMPLTMPAANVTYYAVWGDGSNTPYAIEHYMMNTAGSYELVSRLSHYGTTGSPIVITDHPVVGHTLDTTLSVMTANIAADGTTVLKAYYARNLYTVSFDGVETQVYYGAAIVEPTPESVTGRVFTGWTPSVPETMPANNLSFTSQWDIGTYTITYVDNGTITNVDYQYEAEVTEPAAPVREGYTFLYWADSDENEFDFTDFTMPAENFTLTAIYDINTYTVRYMDFSGVNTLYEYEAEFGAPVPAADGEPTLEHYTFEGWLAVPNTMPAHDVTIFPDFRRVEVTLIAGEGAPTVIDRDNNIIYGLELNVTETRLRDYFLDYTGDGRIELTATAQNCYGTGAIVQLYDNATNTLLETYTIVIFGDVNGDARITTADTSTVKRESFYFEWSEGAGYQEYMMMAADLNRDNLIDATDVTIIRTVVLEAGEVDQVNGTIIHY